MEEKKEIPGLLGLIPRPGFYVTDYLVTDANSAAAALTILPGTDIREWLGQEVEEYENLKDGCLCLTLHFADRDHSASVTRRPEGDLFLLDQEEDREEFRALALAARELRMPLSTVLVQMDQLLETLPEETRAAASGMNRSLYQILRTVGNMSDAGQIAASFRPELQNIAAVISEALDKARTLVDHTGISLRWQPLEEMVLGLVDARQLERVVFNLLSNALKFTPKGGSVEASLIRRGHMLRLTIADSGSGIDREILDNLFYRYLRQPVIEDSRFGLGLGMVLVRQVAANHGGAVLIDRSPTGGTRITITLPIRQKGNTTLRSPLLRPDYTGEWDHGLVELADCLPAFLYDGSY